MRFIHFISVMMTLAVSSLAGGQITTHHENQFIPRPVGFVNFGFALAIQGDRAMINAHESYGHEAVMVFEYDGVSGQWEQIQIALSRDGNNGFGAAIDFDGDFAIFGAPRDHNLDFHAGGAYIFRFDHDRQEWVEHQKLDNEFSRLWDEFGETVALRGNVALVHAPGTRSNGGYGAVYFYKYDVQADQWNYVQELIPNGSEHSGFGNAMDFAADGRLLLGSPSHSGSFNVGGATYVFEYDDQSGQWEQTHLLVPSDLKENQRFGDSVAWDGNTAIIGSPDDGGDYNGAPGSAYIFEYDGVNWVEQTKIESSLAGVQDFHFGYEVDIEGDRVVVSSLADWSYGQEAGAVSVFEKINSEWTETHRLLGYDMRYNQHFGHALALAEGRVLVGSDISGTLEGDVCAFDLDQLGPSVLTLELEGECPGPLTFSASGADPGDRLVLAMGPADFRDRRVIPGCSGYQLDLKIVYATFFREADADGKAVWSGEITDDSFCRFSFQAVNLTKCQKSELFPLR